MTSSIFKDWFHTSFVHQVKSFLKQKGLPIKSILILDNTPCHPPEEFLKADDGSIFVVYMPPNVTPLIQPMDQNIIRIKLYYKKHLLRRAVGKENAIEFLKGLTLKDATSLLMLAWQELKPDVIEKCWHPILCNTFNAVESDDDEENILLKILRQTLQKQKLIEMIEVRDLLQIIILKTTFTEEDIGVWNNIESTLPIFEADTINISFDEDEDNEEIEVPSENERITAKEAVQIFEKAIEWAENNTNDYQNILVLHKFRDMAVEKTISASKKQTNVKDFFLAV